MVYVRISKTRESAAELIVGAKNEAANRAAQAENSSFIAESIVDPPTAFRVLATDGDVMLGGLDWSKRLAEHLVEQFKQKYDLDQVK